MSDINPASEEDAVLDAARLYMTLVPGLSMQDGIELAILMYGISTGEAKIRKAKPIDGDGTCLENRRA